MGVVLCPFFIRIHCLEVRISDLSQPASEIWKNAGFRERMEGSRVTPGQRTANGEASALTFQPKDPLSSDHCLASQRLCWPRCSSHRSGAKSIP